MARHLLSIPLQMDAMIEEATMMLQDALELFRKLGVEVRAISRDEFCREYYRLAKRYHPDMTRWTDSGDLMASINLARGTILRTYRWEHADAARAYRDAASRGRSRYEPRPGGLMTEWL
jgi:hypothetical protein